MNPIIISIVSVPTDEAQKFTAAKTFEPDANLSPLDKPPKAVTEIKGDALRERRLKDWTFTQGIKLEQSVLVKRQAALESAGRKWWTAKLVGYAIGPIGGTITAEAGLPEEKLLANMFDKMANEYANCTLVAKGGQDFHLPFLVGRAMAHDLGLPPQLVSHYPVNDIHSIFGRSAQSTQRGSLSDYCYGIGWLMNDRHDSPQYLYDQHQLGSETALIQMQTMCSEEVSAISELMARYAKRYTSAKAAPKSEPMLAIPF